MATHMSMKNPSDEDELKRFKKDSIFSQVDETMEKHAFTNEFEVKRTLIAQVNRKLAHHTPEPFDFASILEEAQNNYANEIHKFEPEYHRGQLILDKLGIE